MVEKDDGSVVCLDERGYEKSQEVNKWQIIDLSGEFTAPTCAVKPRLKSINCLHSTSSSQLSRPHIKDNRTTATTITTESLRPHLLATATMDLGTTSNTSNNSNSNNNSSTAAEAVEAAVVYWTMDTSALAVNEREQWLRQGIHWLMERELALEVRTRALEVKERALEEKIAWEDARPAREEAERQEAEKAKEKEKKVERFKQSFRSVDLNARWPRR
ncbi:hypothetical protein Q7P36_008836 [Cladosporium allicinum]